jgi:ABC-2 type transport system permease protein
MANQTEIHPMVPPLLQRLRAFGTETAVLFQRSALKLVRRPVMLYFSLVQPVVWLLLFGQIFDRITKFPGLEQAFGGTSYFRFFIPAVILQTLLFGAAQSGIGLINDMDTGFLDKLLTTPVNRMAILLGKALADLTRMLIQGGLIVVIGWLFGQLQAEKVTYAHGIPGLLGGMGIALLFGLGLAAFNVLAALRTRNTETAFLIANFLTLPLLFTSSAQLPVQLLPTWLQDVARVNPVTYAVSSMRILLNGSQSASSATPGIYILETVAILGGITVVFLVLAARTFRRSVH